MRVVVIDDGIAENSISLPLTSYRVVNKSVVLVDENLTSKHSHGTLCARLIFKNIKDVEVISIAVYPELDNGTVYDLLIALEWCVNNDVDIINMSNGFGGYFDNVEVANLCNKLWSQGVNIVAAINNSGEYTMPANLPYAISVAKFKVFTGRSHRIHPDMYASGLIVHKNRHGRICIDFQNSYACAQACNRIIKKLKKRRNKGQFNFKYAYKEIYDFSLLTDIYSFDEWSDNDNLLTFKIKIYKNQNIDKKRVAILVQDSSILTEKRDELIKLFPQIGLLVWCDTYIPTFIRYLCFKNHIPYWCESQSSSVRKLKKTKYNTLKDVYIIAFDNSKNSFRKALELKHHFENGGYTAIVFSSRKKCYLYGAIYSEDYLTIDKLCFEFNPDIAIIIDDYNTIYDWDAKVQCIREDIYLRLNVHMKTQHKCRDTNEIYRTIICNNITEVEDSND